LIIKDDIMKRRFLVLFVLLSVFTLQSCENSYTKLEYHFGEYQVYRQDHGACEMYVMSRIYEDDDFYYYLTDSGCTVDDYYFIRYERKYMNIPKAIEEGIISIDDVIDSKIPNLLIEDKVLE